MSEDSGSTDGRYRWSELEVDSPVPLLSRRRVMGEKAMVAHITLDKGCSVDSHSHENEQFSCILSGALRFGLGRAEDGDYREVVISAGEMIHLPPHRAHSALALENSVVLDVFSPPSEGTGVDAQRDGHS